MNHEECQPIDRTNALEELGDILWYVALAANGLGCEIEEIMQMNQDKLRQRYPGKFKERDAINRNVGAEREVMEGGMTFEGGRIASHYESKYRNR